MAGLTWSQRVTRRLILQKARGHPFRFQSGIGLPLIVGTRFQVLFHSAHRGSFHLSLTVLVHYRSSRVFSLGPWSALLPTRFLVPRGTQDPGRRGAAFIYRAVTVSGGPFQCPSISRSLSNSCASLSRRPQLLLPPICNADRLFHRSGLGCSPFARHYSGNLLFSCGY